MTLEELIARTATAIAENVRDVTLRCENIANAHDTTLEELAERVQASYEVKRERLLHNHEQRTNDFRRRFEQG
jgi:NTP pyrophosphatase (non-canonical NTP hydrolase)